MTQLTRRHLFATAAAAGAATALAPMLGGTAKAAIAAGASGVFRFKVGDIEVTQLRDGARTFTPPDNFVINQSKDNVLAAAKASFMPDGQVTVPFTPMYMSTGGKKVLIDTGNGLATFESTKGIVGQARGNMEAAGIDPKSIDIVLISHFHADHIGGLKNADGTPAFPNAEIKVPAAELAFWSDDANASKANPFNKNLFPNIKKIIDGLKFTKFDGGKEVAPGIQSISTPGHTPGHMSFVIASGSSKIFVQSDVTNIPGLFLKNPNWHAVFDNDPAMAESTRRKFHDMAASEKSMITGYHFPFPCVGYVEKDGSGYRLVPVTA